LCNIDTILYEPLKLGIFDVLIAVDDGVQHQIAKLDRVRVFLTALLFHNFLNQATFDG
jgi:hypothetical protein